VTAGAARDPDAGPDPEAVSRGVADRLVSEDRVAAAFGITVDDVVPGRAIASMLVTDTMLNGVGIAHGGFIFMLADFAFAVASNSYGSDAVSRSCEIEYLTPARAGERLTAIASERIRRGRRGIYDVSVVSQSGEPVAELRGHSSAFGGDR
jgi:acyl-CoA thioesterase